MDGEAGQRRRFGVLAGQWGGILSVGARLGVYANRVRGGLMDGSKSRRSPESSSVNYV